MSFFYQNLPLYLRNFADINPEIINVNHTIIQNHSALTSFGTLYPVLLDIAGQLSHYRIGAHVAYRLHTNDIP